MDIASSAASSADQQSFDSRDIAFKPNSDGWGYTKTYATGWDRIFGKNGGTSEEAAPTAAAAPAPAAAAPAPAADPRLSALENALQAGAISMEIFERARQEGNF